jgi:hypothetical protein
MRFPSEFIEISTVVLQSSPVLFLPTLTSKKEQAVSQLAPLV